MNLVDPLFLVPHLARPAQGSVLNVFLAQERGTPMREVERAMALAERGLKEDRHAAKARGGRRQLLLLEARSLARLGLPAGALKENLVLDNIELESAAPGQRLLLGQSVVVELTEPCIPCWKLDKIRPGLLAQSWGCRGVLARVLTSGVVERGALVRLLDINADAPQPIRPCANVGGANSTA